MTPLPALYCPVCRAYFRPDSDPADAPTHPPYAAVHTPAGHRHPVTRELLEEAPE